MFQQLSSSRKNPGPRRRRRGPLGDPPRWGILWTSCFDLLRASRPARADEQARRVHADADGVSSYVACHTRPAVTPKQAATHPARPFQPPVPSLTAGPRLALASAFSYLSEAFAVNCGARGSRDRGRDFCSGKRVVHPQPAARSPSAAEHTMARVRPRSIRVQVSRMRCAGRLLQLWTSTIDTSDLTAWTDSMACPGCPSAC